LPAKPRSGSGSQGLFARLRYKIRHTRDRLCALATTKMSVQLTSNFCFASCQRGAEAALKREITSHKPGLRAAFQRPGFVTFRSDAPMAFADLPRSVLARVVALSLGSVPAPSAVVEQLSRLPAPLRLHVSERELYRPDEAPPAYRHGELAARIESELRALMPTAFLAGDEAKLGEHVLDVVVAEGEPLWLGLHVHGAQLAPFPGGQYRYELPSDAPSRAYRKIEEAIAAFQLPVRAGDVALELGAAPGGAAYALLRRGVSVIGVDPADMDAHVLSYTGPEGAKLTHHKLPMAELTQEQLPKHVDWLLLDVHLAPQVALRAVSRFASQYKRTLLGAVLTLKLNDWAFLDDVERFLSQAKELGLVDPRARQLPAHRQEIAVAGRTRLGLRRHV
jgi:23S rRNA (cytidine2498-2'-O)-methyltransferase